MAERSLLHKSKLQDFKQWLIKDGWKIESTKGYYEALRATKLGKKRPLIVYDKLDSKEHYSIDNRDLGLIIQFIKFDRAKKEGNK